MLVTLGDVHYTGDIQGSVILNTFVICLSQVRGGDIVVVGIGSPYFVKVNLVLYSPKISDDLTYIICKHSKKISVYGHI